MKEINYGSLKSEDKQGALNEIRLLASIKSEHIITYQETFIDDKTKNLQIIMEYADRGDLTAMIKY